PDPAERLVALAAHRVGPDPGGLALGAVVAPSRERLHELVLTGLVAVPSADLALARLHALDPGCPGRRDSAPKPVAMHCDSDSGADFRWPARPRDRAGRPGPPARPGRASKRPSHRPARSWPHVRRLRATDRAPGLRFAKPWRPPRRRPDRPVAARL